MAAKSRTRRVLLIAAAVLGVLAIVLLLLPRATPVDAAAVVRGPIAETVYDQGQARVRNSYVAAAPVAGRLTRIALQVGDRVSAGQVVARIAPAAAALLDSSVRAQRQAVLASAQADLDRALAEKARAETTLARTQALTDSGVASRQALDNDRAAARSAAAAAASAEAAVRAARAGLIGPQAADGPLVPVAIPASGYVTRVLEPSERTVAAGAPLLEVSDTRDLEAVIEFRSEDAARIRAGMPAEVYDWGGPYVLGARVRLVEPQGFTKVSALGIEETAHPGLAADHRAPGALGLAGTGLPGLGAGVPASRGGRSHRPPGGLAAPRGRLGGVPHRRRPCAPADRVRGGHRRPRRGNPQRTGWWRSGGELPVGCGQGWRQGVGSPSLDAGDVGLGLPCPPRQSPRPSRSASSQAWPWRRSGSR